MKKSLLNLKALFFICLLFTGLSLVAQPSMTFNGGGITQPNANGIGDPYPSTIDVSGIGTGFLQVTVTLTGLSHTSSNDLNIILVGPGGEQCVLMSDVGGSNGINNVEYTFADDSLAMDISNSNPSGTYRPTNNGPTDNWPAPGPGSVTQPDPSLSVFNGANADGTWSLYYNDDASDDSGSLGSWSITFALVSTVDNDDCLDAQFISCGATVAGSTVGALADDERRCGPGTPGPGVWYEFDPTDGGFTQSMSTCNAANFDTRITIYYGHCNRLRCLGSSDDSNGCGNGTEVLFTPFFGKVHYVLVQSSTPAGEGDFVLSYNCDAGVFRPQGAGVVTAEAAQSISLYPNPAGDELNATLEGFAGRQATMRIYNSLGQVAMQRDISRLEDQVERFNTSQLPPGMYYLNVRVEGGETFTERFVVGGARP